MAARAEVIRIGRREFIALLGGGAVWPLAARAQQPSRVPKKLPRIGFLIAWRPLWRDDPFVRGLRDHGYVEGQNLIIEYRIWEGHKDILAKQVAELVTGRVDLILAPTTIAALAAKQATSTIPIVIVLAEDPVGAGLAASLARPGDNVTGLSSQGSDTMMKNFSLLTEILPEASHFAVLMDPGNSLHAQVFDSLEREARTGTFAWSR